ncbi:CHASE2 domain-containing serine/threonine-protein kinase [Plectonema radiosum NIES-515]|uniref:non-specific serine/threonine protein kinase n=1 Tax=Plectonema radiosum NIES-515 TaxID=2986073 RepID=A0ABT3B1W9_9CYAN|nr:CHASE2 domain-containing serine/threonine-protein kinase [Plectonema radiosum]MCV3215342.1 CHASE2 domain-containing serine/threonine-protein kinase [Plectonema radiosum NIES-515]
MIRLLEKFRTALVKNRQNSKLEETSSGEASLTPRCNIRDTAFNKGWLPTILIASVGVTVFIAGIRDLRWLQPWELRVYDQMLRQIASGSASRSRPEKASVRRILLVTITEADIKRQKWPLSDATINQLLDKLESYKPRIIGLNIYRDLPVEPGYKLLANHLSRQNNIIAVCGFSSPENPEIPPPPSLSEDKIGFSDFVPDENDHIVRRSLLFAQSDDKKCHTNVSFAALLAINYLQKQGIKTSFTKEEIQIGKTLFPILKSNSGSYEHLDAAGYQIMLNYRHLHRLADKVTLTEVLNNQVNPNLIKDRLVIIGTTATSIDKDFYTPYSALPNQPSRMPPVYIHAQIASQIMSAVLDGEPLIWYLPEWGEYVCIWCASLVGAAVAWHLRHPLGLVVVGVIILSSLGGFCYLLFLQAGWMPVIPQALALVISGVSVMAYTTYQTQQKSKLIILEVEKQEEAIAQLNVLLKETEIQDQHLHTSTTIIPEKRTGDLLLSGRYKIIKVLTSGGFGRIYLAEDTQRPGNPNCIVKQLMPARRDSRFMEVARRLFNTEAEILEVLGEHHQIPKLLAYFEENQEFYLVEQYIPGHTLSEELPPVIRRVQKESFVIEMLKEVLDILAFVHQHRVIHRDIKPSNLIRSKIDNRLVLIDFGAVKLMQPPSSEETELATVAIGTRGYAPPEQFAGHPRLNSDIYALGMIAIQALTGVPPQELPPDLETGNVRWRQWAKVSDELATILDKMVRYHFSDRYQSANAVLEDLKRIGE